MKNQITEKSYELTEHDEEENFRIKLNETYKGVEIKVHTVSLKMDDNGDTATLSFDYGITKCPKKFNQKDLTESKDFTDFTGDVITHIIQSAFDSGKYTFGDPIKANDDSATGNNPKKTRKRRAVLP